MDEATQAQEKKEARSTLAANLFNASIDNGALRERSARFRSCETLGGRKEVDAGILVISGASLLS